MGWASLIAYAINLLTWNQLGFLYRNICDLILKHFSCMVKIFQIHFWSFPVLLSHWRYICDFIYDFFFVSNRMFCVRKQSNFYFIMFEWLVRKDEFINFSTVIKTLYLFLFIRLLPIESVWNNSLQLLLEDLGWCSSRYGCWYVCLWRDWFYWSLA